jgi:hypothetical protein
MSDANASRYAAGASSCSRLSIAGGRTAASTTVRAGPARRRRCRQAHSRLVALRGPAEAHAFADPGALAAGRDRRGAAMSRSILLALLPRRLPAARSQASR